MTHRRTSYAFYRLELMSRTFEAWTRPQVCIAVCCTALHHSGAKVFFMRTELGQERDLCTVMVRGRDRKNGRTNFARQGAEPIAVCVRHLGPAL